MQTMQTSKTINFLKKQNKALKEEIIELKDLIKVNKESLQILTTQGAKPPTSRLNITTPSFGDATETRVYLDHIKRLNNKNTDLTEKIFQLQKQKDQLSAQILVLEQISEATEKQSKQMLNEIGSEIKGLNETLQTAEFKLLETEKNTPEIDSMSGLVIKFKQIYNANEQTIAFKQRETELYLETLILKEEITRLQDDQKRLISLNVNLKNEITKLKATMLMPNRSPDRLGEDSIKKLALYFLEAQRRLVRGEDSDSEDQNDLDLIGPEIGILFPDKVNKVVRKDKQKVPIPKLNLKKVYDIMSKNRAKISIELKRRNPNITKTERFTRLQEQLEFTRRELTKALLSLREAEEKNSKLERSLKQATSRNEILLKAYEQRDRSKQALIRKKTADLNQTYNVSYNNCTFIDKKSARPDPKKMVNQTLPNENTDFNLGFREEVELQASNMAYEIEKLPFMKNIKEKHGIRKKKHQSHQKEAEPQGMIRSYSNPLLYVQQRKQLIYPRRQQQRILPVLPHHDETCFVQMQANDRRFLEDLDNINLP